MQTNQWTNYCTFFLKHCVTVFVLSGVVHAQTNLSQLSPAELKKLSLEELMNQEVTLVTRSPEKLSESASSVQVVSAEDIKRSGATTLPEALRLAPNLHVAQFTAHDWGISARGFNGAPSGSVPLANKLLVMIDGRSVYTPLFGGVFWDVQHVLLEDLDRIEVISGPGGTLWGVNAVNGVINIVTKSAKETQGLYVSGGGGTFLQDFGAVRYGGSITSNLFFRVYGQRFDHEHTEFMGADVNDEWDRTQGGFRMDYHPSSVDAMTLQGDLYGGEEGDPVQTELNGQNILGRWTHVFSEESDLSAQFYFDRTWRNVPDSAPNDAFSDDLQTYDFDFQHRFPIGSRQSIVWGAGYRLNENKMNNSAALIFSPSRRSLQVFSAFLQDEITLVTDRLKLTLGAKLEHNDYSGLEVQPSARLSWALYERNMLWAAVSRAVRSPSRFDTDASVPGLPVGNRDFDSEKMIAYELGYRVRPAERVSFSLAGFFNQYDDLRTLNIPPGTFENDQKADTWGLELAANYQATDWWRLRGGYTYFESDFRSTSPTVAPGSDELEGLDPRHQVILQSIVDLPWHFQFDTVARYVDKLPPSPINGVPPVPDYISFDVRLAWEYKNWEIAVIGKNLWDDQHAEFAAQIPRSIFAKITARF